MVLQPASAIQREVLDWLWPMYLPAGEVVLIDGERGQGKSLVTLDLAARVSTARALPDGHRLDAPGGVVWLSEETIWDDVAIERLHAAEPDATRVHRLCMREPGEPWRALSLPRDGDILERAIRQVQARLVIVDPLTRFLPPRLPVRRDGFVRYHVLPALTRAARDTGACILVARRLTRSRRSRILRTAGSFAVRNAVRIAYRIARDPHEPDRHLLACAKNSAGPRPPTLAFRIVRAANHVPRVHWLGSSPLGVEDIDAPDAAQRIGALDRAAMFLDATLAAGPLLHAELLRLAAAEGIRLRTLERAKAALSIQSIRCRENGRDLWTWALPGSPGD
jgi:hypothetical protein